MIGSGPQSLFFQTNPSNGRVSPSPPRPETPKTRRAARNQAGISNVIKRALLFALLFRALWEVWARVPRLVGNKIVLLVAVHHYSPTPLPCLSATEFDFRVVGDGKSAIARYANNSNYRNDFLIRKESTCCAVLTIKHASRYFYLSL